MTTASPFTRAPRVLIALLALLLWPVAGAQQRTDDDLPTLDLPAESPFLLTALWENDGGILRPGGPDRYYTNGLLLSLAHQPDWAAGLADSLGLEHTATAAAWHLGHLIFTPRNLLAPIPDPDDRPYAGYLYGGVQWQRENHDTLDHIQIDLGIVGPSSGADDIQTWVHDWFLGDDPAGWDSQIADTFAWQVTWRRKWRIDFDGPGRDDRGLNWQLIPQAGLSLGNVHRQAELAATVRVGQHLPDDFGPAFVQDPGSATGLGRARDGIPWHWSVFGKAGVRFVEHNIFLDGPDDEPGPSVDAEPIVGEFAAGIELRHRIDRRWSIDLSYANTFRTHEFETQERDSIFATFMINLRGTW